MNAPMFKATCTGFLVKRASTPQERRYNVQEPNPGAHLLPPPLPTAAPRAGLLTSPGLGFRPVTASATP